MEFSIIYEFDIPKWRSVRDCMPRPSIRRKMMITEAGHTEDLDGLWENGKHRKLCGILNRKQFDDFLSDTGLFVEQCHTLGSLGAPGCGFGLAPAVPFRNDDSDAYQSAYVTPLPRVERKEGYTERDFARIERVMWRMFS